MKDERTLDESMGGEVAERLRDVHGESYQCHCGNQIPFTKGGGFVMGYPHRDGTPDAEGETWWMFVHCIDCGVDKTLGKVETQLSQ